MFYAYGKITENVLPLPTSDSTSIRPFIFCMMIREMESLNLFLVQIHLICKNLSNISFCSSFVIPFPESSTDILTSF